MQRKPGFPVAHCSIRMPDNLGTFDGVLEDDSEQQHRRQQLINFGHSQWGFNNWSWAVTKQELDFVEMTNGKYTSGVVAFVSVTVKSLDIHRENIGYATSTANNKGFAIYKSRKCAVTNGLRETLLSFGGSVATDLLELLDTNKTDLSIPAPSELLTENNQNVANKPSDVKNMSKNVARKDDCLPRKDDCLPKKDDCLPRKDDCLQRKDEMQRMPLVKNAPANPNFVPPIAKTHPMPPSLPPAASRPRPAPLPRPSNEAKLENMTEEEARAERKRRQRLAQEEFRQKQILKHTDTDDKRELSKHSSSLDQLLMELPSLDIVIQESPDPGSTGGKRKSPETDGNAAIRRVSRKLDIV